MKIELYPHEFRKDVYHLSVNDVFFREIHVSIFGKRPKFSFFGDSNIEKQFFDKEVERAKLFVLRRLSKRSYSTYEIRKQLKERFVSDKAIDCVVSDCLRLGYLDDHQWVEQFIDAQKLKKIGPKSIAFKLIQKGVPESFFSSYLESRLSKEQQLSSIFRLIEVRYRSRDFDDYQKRQKVVAALARKGYSYDLIQEAIERYHC